MNESERIRDTVIVRVVVTRMVLEERVDVDGHPDFYVIKSDVVSEREWVEERKRALSTRETL